MCGIAGIAGGAPEAARIESMTARLAHRGPDGAGTHVAEGVALGHRRLSVIDLAGGAQPMSYAGGRYWITYNGEVYNYRGLRRELEAKGHTFRTASDTEVLLAAYAEYGPDCVTRFDGMFAFAIWDAEARSLFLARDHVGVKPLYYARLGERLAFASEMKALLEIPEVDRGLDAEALDDYLNFLHTVPPRTFYRGIRQLPPAHYAIWLDGAWHEQRYWRLELAPEERPIETWVEELDARLGKTVRAQLVSDVPVGAFLSGGLDSAGIVAHMGVDKPRTFTVGFGAEGRHYDETDAAARAAKHLGTQHLNLRVDADAAALLPRLLEHFDEPFANPTALLTYALCEEVRKHVTVVLSGDGGDECFGGYARYAGLRYAARYAKLPAAVRRALRALARRLPESTTGRHARRRLRTFAEAGLLDGAARYAAWQRYYNPEALAALYAPDLRERLHGRDAAAPLLRHAEESGTDDPVAQAMYVDLHSFLPHNVLQYGDRMSMAHGLEVRVPLADPELFAFMARVPSGLKVRGGETKYLFRRSLAGRLPRTHLDRSKLGFNPPMGAWLNGPLRPLLEETLSESALRAGGHFDPAVVARMRDEHQRGQRDHTWRLWALLLFQAWLRR